MRRLGLLLALAPALAGVSCVGELGDPPPPPSVVVAAPAFAPAAVTLHRLTVSQYQNSVRDLFGKDVFVPDDLEKDTLQHGFSTVAASALTISPHAEEQ